MMKPLKAFFLIASMVIILCLVAYSSSGLSLAKEASGDQETTESTQKDEDSDALNETDTPGEIETRMNKCFSCCNTKFLVCINIHPDRRICAAEKENCLETCKSEGASPSSWSECWSQSATE